MTAGIPNSCPCCGAPLTVAQAIDAPRLGAMQQALVNIVRAAAPERVQTARIINALWRGNDEPKDSSNIVSVMVRQINAKTTPYGFKIECGMGRRDGYKLVLL